jgi:hypothetical protein
MPQSKKPFSVWSMDISHIISKRMRGYGSEDWNYTPAGKALDALSNCLITFSKTNNEIRRDSVFAKNIHRIIQCFENFRKREIRTEATEKLRIHSLYIIFYFACTCRIEFF